MKTYYNAVLLATLLFSLSFGGKLEKAIENGNWSAAMELCRNKGDIFKKIESYEKVIVALDGILSSFQEDNIEKAKYYRIISDFEWDLVLKHDGYANTLAKHHIPNQYVSAAMHNQYVRWYNNSVSEADKYALKFLTHCKNGTRIYLKHKQYDGASYLCEGIALALEPLESKAEERGYKYSLALAGVFYSFGGKADKANELFDKAMLLLKKDKKSSFSNTYLTIVNDVKNIHSNSDAKIRIPLILEILNKNDIGVLSPDYNAFEEAFALELPVKKYARLKEIGLLNEYKDLFKSKGYNLEIFRQYKKSGVIVEEFDEQRKYGISIENYNKLKNEGNLSEFRAAFAKGQTLDAFYSIKETGLSVYEYEESIKFNINPSQYKTLKSENQLAEYREFNARGYSFAAYRDYKKSTAALNTSSQNQFYENEKAVPAQEPESQAAVTNPVDSKFKPDYKVINGVYVSKTPSQLEIAIPKFRNQLNSGLYGKKYGYGGSYHNGGFILYENGNCTVNFQGKKYNAEWGFLLDQGSKYFVNKCNDGNPECPHAVIYIFIDNSSVAQKVITSDLYIGKDEKLHGQYYRRVL